MHQPAQTLTVMVVYDDMEAGLKAQEQIHNITRQFGPGGQPDLRFWKYDFLDEHHLWPQAVADAEEADLILFSMSTSLVLPTRIMRWVARWREAGVIEGTSFALLTSSECRDHSLVRLVRRFLRQAARTQDTEFIKGSFPARQATLSARGRSGGLEKATRNRSARGRRCERA